MIEIYDSLRDRTEKFAEELLQGQAVKIEDTGRLDILSRQAGLISTEKVADTAGNLWIQSFLAVGDMNKALGDWYEQLDSQQKSLFLAACKEKKSYELPFIKDQLELHRESGGAALGAFIDSVREELVR